MKLLQLTQNEVIKLRQNTNTGIEYEYALFYALLNLDDQEFFYDNIINYHAHKQRIDDIIKRTNIDIISDNLKNYGYEIFGYKLATQDDSVGPADILLQCKSDKQTITIGISVKYNNTCTCNCSYHHFISIQDKQRFQDKLKEYVQRHITIMQTNYGNAHVWFRNRKYCDSTMSNQFIDLIRDKVISTWATKSKEDKMQVLSTTLQMISPILYWVYTYKENSEELDTSPFHIKEDEIDKVVVSKNAGQFVRFSLNDKVFAQMQIKFNNGILERYKGIRNQPDIICDGIPMKFGDAFGSWNFSLY